MARRRRGKYIRSTLIPLKPPKPKNPTTTFTFVGGPWDGQRAKLSASFRETNVIRCGKCKSKGRYKLTQGALSLSWQPE